MTLYFNRIHGQVAPHRNTGELGINPILNTNKKQIEVTLFWRGIKMKHFFVLAGIAIVLLSQLGCSSDEEQAEVENPAVIDEASAFSGAPLLGDVVLENMYEAEARQLTDKTPVQIVTVIEGTNRVTLEAQFRGVRDFGFGFPLYEFEFTDKLAEENRWYRTRYVGKSSGSSGTYYGRARLRRCLCRHTATVLGNVY